MVQNIITLTEEEDRILNIVKATQGLKNKNQAVAFLLKEYDEKHLKKPLKHQSSEKKEASVQAHHSHGHYIG